MSVYISRDNDTPGVIISYLTRETIIITFHICFEYHDQFRQIMVILVECYVLMASGRGRASYVFACSVQAAPGPKCIVRYRIEIPHQLYD